MSYTVVDVFGSLAAACTFALLLLPLGYLLASAFLFPRLASRPRPPEQLLWSVVLSLPCALVLANLLGRVVSSGTVLGCFGVALVAAAGRLFVTLRHRQPAATSPIAAPERSATRAVLLAVAALLAYVVLMTASVQIGGHLYEGVHSSDWSVRMPLVNGAIRDGVPPDNPMFAVGGTPQTMRYYFYWYVLCAQVGRLTGLSARACFSGSVAWSAFGLVSILFLYLKYLVRVQTSLRRQCLLLLGLCCVMSVDILPAIAGLFTHRLAPEVEWWREDRAPSFLGAILFAPHHIGGLVCAATGVLVLALAGLRPLTPLREDRGPLLTQLGAALIAGICFAAACGTSTYITLCFAFICVAYGIHLLMARQWMALSALALAGVVALALSHTFLHEMLSRPALDTATGTSGTHRFFKVTVRDARDSIKVARHFYRRITHKRIQSRRIGRFAGIPFVLPMMFFELGFFMFPIGIRLWRDLRILRAGGRLSTTDRILWAFLLGILVPALTLSSEPTQGVNDFGRHAGLILRFWAILVSTPIVFDWMERWRARQPVLPNHPLVLSFAMIFLLLGLLSQVWQIAMERTFLMLAEHRIVPIEAPFAPDTDIAARYFDLRRGFTDLSRLLPSRAIVQSNPGSRYGAIVMLYSPFQFAAADSGCESAFGGSVALCKPVVNDLQALFGGPDDSGFYLDAPRHTIISPDAERTTTPEIFAETCRREHLSAVVALNTDPAWSFPHSWVWQRALYQTPMVRIIACPAGSAA